MSVNEPQIWSEISGIYQHHIEPFLGKFSDAVIARLAQDGLLQQEHTRALDVACGPGTASLRLAPHVAEVRALDFAPDMIARLQETAAARGIANVHAVVGDGQNLPFDDDVFDVALSMFGLMFFPDRQRGFDELHRALRPGGRVVVAAWCPPERSQMIHRILSSVAPSFPELAESQRFEPGLDDQSVFRAELRRAGFRDVEIVEVEETLDAPSPEAFWALVEASFAPMVLLKKRLGAARFAQERDVIVARLHQRTEGAWRAPTSIAYIAFATA